MEDLTDEGDFHKVRLYIAVLQLPSWSFFLQEAAWEKTPSSKEIRAQALSACKAQTYAVYLSMCLL